MPQITGAGIVLPKLPENDRFYTEYLENSLKKVRINNKKAILK